ncbi:hypothetical protein A2V94_04630 [Candidatus Atribacteria bacterium RBG_16_35_8]|nr:MAG: hypothetical protein A2V94_04630 [Candidatus Atribacteria bacterium RBG_16_35_8]
MGNTSLVYFAFRIKIKGTISKDKLEEVLLKVQQKHPLAGVRVIMTGDKKQFITTENVPRIPLSEFNGDEIDWKTVVKDELCNPFDIFKGPMIRVFLINRENISDIVVIFHHAICDGLSAVVFLNDLFLFLSNPLHKLNAFTEAFTLTELIKQDILDIIKTRGLPGWMKKGNKPELKPVKKEPIRKPDFAIHDWFFTEDDTKKIILFSKKNNVTVHSILSAAFLKSFAQEFGPEEGYKRVLQSPISFRPFLVEEAKNYFGLFNGLIEVGIDCSPEKTITEIAMEIYTKFKEQLDNYDPLPGYYHFNEHFLEGIEDPELFFSNRPDQPMNYDFSLSNLGRIQIQKKYGQYEIEKIYGPIFSAIRGEKVISVNTHQGRMFFTCIYDKNCFDTRIGRTLIRRALDKIKDIK